MADNPGPFLEHNFQHTRKKKKEKRTNLKAAFKRLRANRGKIPPCPPPLSEFCELQLTAVYGKVGFNESPPQERKIVSQIQVNGVYWLLGAG